MDKKVTNWLRLRLALMLALTLVIGLLLTGEPLSAWAEAGSDELPAGYYEALKLIEQRQPRRALPLLLESLSETGGNAEILTTLGDLYYQRGELLKAVRAYEQVLALQPGRPGIRVSLARIFEKLGDSTIALDLLNQERAQVGDSAQIFELLTTGYLAAGDFQRGLESCRSWQKLAGESAHSAGIAAELLIGLGRGQEALAYLKRSVEKYAENAGAGRIFYLLGKLLLTADEIDAQAEQYLRQALKLKPELTGAWFELGRLELDRGNYREAAGCFRAVVELDSRYPQALFLLADSTHRSGFSEAALEILKLALQSNRNDAGAYCLLAEILISRAEMDKAREALRRALELQPDLAEAYYFLGLVAERSAGKVASGTSPGMTGAIAEAEKNYRLCLLFDPDHGAAAERLAGLRNN